MERLRVASLQYWIRPVASFDEFRDQVSGLVQTAVDYNVRLVVFPEYFTIQLMTLGDVRGPADQQVQALSQLVDPFVELMSSLSKKHQLYIVAGSIPVMDDEGEGQVYNESFFFGPSGEHGRQGKIHMTRWEREDWGLSPRPPLKVFETELGRLAIAICYDVEFPEIARAAARQGCSILVVPSCTDDRQGFLRVRYCAHARCIENQLYVIHSSTVGSLPMVPSVALNYGQASILTPSDFPFARDGILAEGVINQETMVIAELNLKSIDDSRTFGTVLPLYDSQHTSEVVAQTEVLAL